MDFPAAHVIGKRVHVVLRSNEQTAPQGPLRLAKIQEARIRDARGDWMLVEPANWTGPAWVNLQHVLYLDLFEELKEGDA